MDFLGTIRLVNYLRSEIKKGNKEPNVSSAALFEDDVYLKPVLEDDALLYSLDDLAEEVETTNGKTSSEQRIMELQEELENLRNQFSEYRLAVQNSMSEELSKADDSVEAQKNGPRAQTKGKIEEADADYFTSYSFNGSSL